MVRVFFKEAAALVSLALFLATTFLWLGIMRGAI